jgi:hypothetical protein
LVVTVKKHGSIGVLNQLPAKGPWTIKFYSTISRDYKERVKELEGQMDIIAQTINRSESTSGGSFALRV